MAWAGRSAARGTGTRRENHPAQEAVGDEWTLGRPSVPIEDMTLLVDGNENTVVVPENDLEESVVRAFLVTLAEDPELKVAIQNCEHRERGVFLSAFNEPGAFALKTDPGGVGYAILRGE